MNLLFICTSLEPGRDGVGDYARLLAAACADAGHRCALLALNDPHITASAVSTQSAPPHALPVLRLSAGESWRARLVAARHFARDHAPDWLSWQIVPYGFHPKGVIPPSVRTLAAELATGGRNHVMLHELWLGLSREEPPRHRLTGFLQRGPLLRLLRAISPDHTDTTNAAYQHALRRRHIPAALLPLFGNIPVATPLAHAADAGTLTAVLFGTIHPQFLATLPPVRVSRSSHRSVSSPRNLFVELASHARATQRRLRILALGHNGEHARALAGRLASAFPPADLAYETLGEKPAPEVSRILQAADLGIATHPWALLGKSGAVAAMLDHGLPVIVPRDDWRLRRGPSDIPAIDPLAARLADLPVADFTAHLARRRPAKNSLPGVAEKFLAHLGQFSVADLSGLSLGSKPSGGLSPETTAEAAIPSSSARGGSQAKTGNRKTKIPLP
ncbi:hypothetical protein OH491_22645 [Termitidicoccus mucosus]|uniref:Glycosyltransferase subfamily 4-like N-terminal domain-containing protein n=1 Tax=Termitidicoccus mucosus TaxID=1184151 RepID=A0A178IPT8_9BACT|nr:hypothetical protein AW736_03830 [Opitutaceae bacterium TSB47]